MSENLKDILTHLHTDIDQHTMLQYLKGQLTPAKQQQLEEQLLDNDFEKEALEGLEHFRNKEDLSHLVSQLNADLRKKTLTRRQRREKLKLKGEPTIWIALVLVLLLACIGFYLVYMLRQ